MGQLVNVKCNKCGYETNLGLGNGRTYNQLDAVISFFDKETRDKIRALVDSGTVTWEVYKVIGICEKCGKISAIAVFKALDTEGNVTQYHSRCQCGSGNIELYDLDKVMDGSISITCPVCGDKLEAAATGYWD